MIYIMQRVLFQGDSITDAGRTRDNDTETGRGCQKNCPKYNLAFIPLMKKWILFLESINQPNV